MAGDQVVRCTTGLIYYTGYSIPVLIAMAVGLIMTFIATRTSFGRYVYATGGNPEAAELAGINTKWLTVKVFCADGLPGWRVVHHFVGPPQCRHQLAGPVERALRDRRRGDRRHVAGGRHRHDLWRHAGCAADAIAAIGHDAAQSSSPPIQNIVVGAVLVVAVFVDQVYRRRLK